MKINPKRQGYADSLLYQSVFCSTAFIPYKLTPGEVKWVSHARHRIEKGGVPKYPNSDCLICALQQIWLTKIITLGTDPIRLEKGNRVEKGLLDQLYRKNLRAWVELVPPEHVSPRHLSALRRKKDGARMIARIVARAMS